MTLITCQQAMGRSVAPFRAARIAAPPLQDEYRSEARDQTPETGALPRADSALPRLETRIQQLEEALELERDERSKACESAYAEGTEKGRTEAGTREAERLELLRHALEDAVADCIAKIEERTDLAVSIARAALQKILGPGGDHEGMVEAIIRHDTLQLASNAILRVRVSAEDFPDEAALVTLSSERGDVEIVRDPQLKSGSCLFELKLGTIDASLDVQAQKLDELLAGVTTDPGTRA